MATIGECLTIWNSSFECGNKAKCISESEMDGDVLYVDSENVQDENFDNKKLILIVYVKHSLSLGLQKARVNQQCPAPIFIQILLHNDVHWGMIFASKRSGKYAVIYWDDFLSIVPTQKIVGSVLMIFQTSTNIIT